jgi:hypothetical protein
MEGQQPEKKEKMTDMELFLSLAGHIKQPCEDLEGNNIRDFYIREAKRVLPTFTNEYAKGLLEDLIKEYSV